MCSLYCFNANLSLTASDIFIQFVVLFIKSVLLSNNKKCQKAMLFFWQEQSSSLPFMQLPEARQTIPVYPFFSDTCF